MRQPRKWWIGLPIVAALVYFATGALAPRIESDIARRVDTALANANGAVDHPQIFVRGRDAGVSGVVLSLEQKNKALAEVRRIAGLRDLHDDTFVIGVAQPFVLGFERRGKVVTLNGSVPISGEREKLRGVLEGLGLEVVDKTNYASGAPAGFFDLAQFAALRVAELDPGRASVTDDTLAISGEARGAAEYEKAIEATKAPPLAARVTTAEISPPRVSPYVWSAANSGDMVVLSGFIPSNELRAGIVAKAAAIGAGVAVSDASVVGAGAPEGDFNAAIGFALTELGKLAQGKATIRDTKITIEGQGRDNVAAATIETDAKAGLPPGFELAKVDVAAGAISPYDFSALKSDAALTLSGHIPDVAAREKILDAVRRIFRDANVTDNLVIAKGAPKGFVDAALASLPGLARLDEGRLTVADGIASLEGSSLHQGAPADIERRLSASLPQGFKGATRLTVRTAGSSLDAEKCRAGLSAILDKGAFVFDADGATIADDSAPLFDALAALVLRCQDYRLEIAAHADAVGVEEVLRAITKRRAQAVVELLTRAGADPSKLTPVGYGGERPIAPNDSEENRARNRRVEFLVR